MTLPRDVAADLVKLIQEARPKVTLINGAVRIEYPNATYEIPLQVQDQAGQNTARFR